MKKRFLDLDFSRGFAMILIILGHILRGLNESGILIANFDKIDFIIYSLHLPILFIVSGIIECKKVKIQYSEGEIIKFLKNIFLSLYVPYLIFILIYWFIKMYVFSGNNEATYIDLLYIFISGKWIFWYLLSLLFIKIFHYFFEYINKILLGFVFFSVIYILNFYFNFIVFLWLSYGIFYSIGYIYEFYVGSKNFSNRLISIILSIFLIICFLFFNYVGFNIFIGMIIYGIPFSLLFINLFKKIKVQNMICKIGEYSMILYLTHTIITSIVRTFLLKMNITSINVHVFVALFASILASFLMVFIYKNIKLFSFIEYLFYPSKIRKLRGNI